MIPRTMNATMPRTLRSQASQASRPARSPIAPALSAAAATRRPRAAAGTIHRLAQPAESLWYRIKKAIISFVSNFEIGKRDKPGVTAAMARDLLPQMQPGDILLRRTEGSSGNFFIPSWWKHAGVYLGGGQVVDAVFKGIGQDDLAAFMTGGDAIMIVRPKGLSASQREAIADYARRQIGKPYDFDFDFRDEARFSCTELASQAVRAGAGRDLVELDWMGAVTADDFKNANFELIWSNVPEEARF